MMLKMEYIKGAVTTIIPGASKCSIERTKPLEIRCLVCACECVCVCVCVCYPFVLQAIDCFLVTILMQS